MNLLALFPLALCPLALARPAGDHATFDAMAFQSGPVHLAVFKAAEGSLLLNMSDQHATCKGENNRATFYLKDSELFLYSENKLVQQVGVDRSRKGQGRIDYLVAKGMSHPQQYQFKGWTIETGRSLFFDDKSFQACPSSTRGSWTVWTTDYANPAGNSGCVSFTAKAYPNSFPISCVYS